MSTELIDVLGETRLVAVGSLLMDKPVGGGFVDYLHRLLILFGRFILLRLGPDVFDGGTKLRPEGPVSQAVIFRLAHPLFTRLMIGQGISFQTRSFSLTR